MAIKDYYLLVLETRNKILYLQSNLDKKGKNYFQLVSAPTFKSGYGCNYALKIPNKSYFQMLKDEIELLELGDSKMFLVEKKDNKLKYKEVEF